MLYDLKKVEGFCLIFAKFILVTWTSKSKIIKYLIFPLSQETLNIIQRISLGSFLFNILLVKLLKLI